MQAKISVVVTVYNEEENIRPLVEQISNALEGYEYEIVYVDDGSTDNTLIIPNLRIENVPSSCFTTTRL